MSKDLQPQFPLYIPSKGRHEYMITSKQLSLMGVKHYVVVEPQQVSDYEKAVREMKLLTTVLPLDMSYKDKYELCDEFGLKKSTGPGPARNFAWEHSISNRYKWHWVMDDNIRSFRRLNNNEKVKCESPAFWKAMEDFCLRYTNVGMAGPNYYMFAPARTKQPPFITNTRIYSCNLIRNDIPFRWRGRYNEDTIISLDMLKAGWCTIQFNAFLQEKMPTQVVKGGNTEEFYHKEGTVQKGQKYADTGTIAKSQMQVAVHPDVSKLVWKFNRWHHHVDYTPFKNQKLIKKSDINISNTVNNYGMGLKQRVK
tara:strand:+ start:293 stop:1222 length:930 start_codon:yes stop_codon:yes gene_type:complete